LTSTLKCNKKEKEEKRPKRGEGPPCDKSKGGFFFLLCFTQQTGKSRPDLFQLSKDVFARIKPRTPHNYNSYLLQFENNKIQTSQKTTKIT
jgi:hypothetical protein